ncbi:ANTH domain-containing protein [Hysterangium stoloniferum]|nr:ANTH domain-containing protein [Hysterangium stoloniferum]
MSSFDKVVKLACKPKAAPPKAKYLDPIIAATWSEDGAVVDVCKALSPRFREPNAVVVFKALIVLHTMIRNGATDNVLSYLSSGDVLRLRNVADGQWEGYDTPQNLKCYAFYLDSRVRAYRDLKHDAVRVQSESNRDMRMSQSIEDSLSVTSLAGGSRGVQRSKTLAGRKLRSMTVEKGLLRETKAVHRVIDALLECKFYQDDLQVELTITALRMLVKDLLVLFQAGNEGVINVLEHYFEMSHIDAEQALSIYRHFCKQTEAVMEFLNVARKLENILNIPIPNLKHAPVSLAGALEEYLKDPNFEQNRLEYKANKAAADRSQVTPRKSAIKEASGPSSSSTPPVPKLDQVVIMSGSSTSKTETSQTMADFFESIEKEQQPMFGGQPAGPSSQIAFQTPQPVNPFVQRSVFIPTQMTGGFIQQPQPFLQAQPTGFVQPQHTAFQASPFLQVREQQSGTALFLQANSQFEQQRQSMFMQPQNTGLLQPQATGSNPFRQSMMFPQMSAGPLFAASGVKQISSQQSQSAQETSFVGNMMQQNSPFVASPTSSNTPLSVPNRPQSTPITSQQKPVQSLTAVTTHQTGSKNPFGAPVQPAPPVPKPPTLQELATGLSNGDQSNAFPGNNTFSGFSNAFGNGSILGGFQQAQRPASPKPNNQALYGGSTMASIASSFAAKPPQAPTANTSSSNSFSSAATQHTATSAFPDSSNSLTSQPTGSTAQTTAPSVASLQPQQTGFGGIKPFKPTSSFGTTLLDSLPAIADSPTKPSIPFGNSNAKSPISASHPSFLSSHPTGFPSPNTTNFSSNITGLPSPDLSSFPFKASSTPAPGLGALNAQPWKPNFTSQTNFANGNGLAVGLKPQTTGGPNPFRASMMIPSNTPSFSANPPFPSPGFSSFQQGSLLNNLTGVPPLNGVTTAQSPTGTAPPQHDASRMQTGSLI